MGSINTPSWWEKIGRRIAISRATNEHSNFLETSICVFDPPSFFFFYFASSSFILYLPYFNIVGLPRRINMES